MKKLVSFVLALAMALSLSAISAAALGTSEQDKAKDAITNAMMKGKILGDEKIGKIKEAEAKLIEKKDDITKIENSKIPPALKEEGLKLQELKKQYKTELNQERKQLQAEKASFEQQLVSLKVQYEKLVANGDEAGPKVVLEKMQALEKELSQMKEKVKQAINERHMIVKTMYSEEELAQFNNASELIAKLYQDANTLAADSITVNNQIIKFDAPAYIKAGVTLVPLRAIAEGLGAKVTWDQATQTVKILKGDTVIEMKANSTTALVNGTPTEINLPAQITSGRVYLPLRFLAETLNCDVSWDKENQIIDIDQDSASGATTDSTASTLTDASKVPAP